MPQSASQDLDPKALFVAADGYAAMFEDAPAPTAEDLRDLQPAPRELLPFEQFEPSVEQPATERSAPDQRRLRIAAVA